MDIILIKTYTAVHLNSYLLECYKNSLIFSSIIKITILLEFWNYVQNMHQLKKQFAYKGTRVRTLNLRCCVTSKRYRLHHRQPATKMLQSKHWVVSVDLHFKMKYLSLFISLLVIQNVFGEEDPGLIEEANDIPEGKKTTIYWFTSYWRKRVANIYNMALIWHHLM